MPDYKSMYFDLFNTITHVVDMLQDAQQRCESAYIESHDTPLFILSNLMDEKPENAKNK